jgi:ribosomal protein L21E
VKKMSEFIYITDEYPNPPKRISIREARDVGILMEPSSKKSIKEYFKNVLKRKEQKVMKFKVGDKVKIVSPRGYAGQKFKGMTGEVTGFGKTNIDHEDAYALRFDGEIENSCFWWRDDEVASADTFIKSDLKDGMVVENRYGHRYMVMGEKLIGPDYYGWLSNYTDALTHKHSEPGNLHSHYDIIKVYKSNSCSMQNYFESGNLELIWKREEPYKEMTVAEIEKKLGYKVKIVDGE